MKATCRSDLGVSDTVFSGQSLSDRRPDKPQQNLTLALSLRRGVRDAALLDDASFAGVANDFHSVVQSQLLQQVGAMCLDRRRADREQLGNLLAAASLRYELQDLALPLRE
jgi:hypothetical protein